MLLGSPLNEQLGRFGVTVVTVKLSKHGPEAGNVQPPVVPPVGAVGDDEFTGLVGCVTLPPDVTTTCTIPLTCCCDVVDPEQLLVCCPGVVPVIV
jgi:hypothetical protein